MKKYRFYTVLMAGVWLFVTGSFTPQAFVSGLIMAYPVAFVFRRFYPGSFRLKALKRSPYLFLYFLHFLKELLVSNLDVAYRVLHPEMPVDPEVVELRTELSDPTAVTLLANSITLTPGTLVIDYIEERNTFLIHCLNMEDEEEVKKGVRYWEKLLKKAFGEER